MDTVKRLVLCIFLISFAVFVSLWGRLPVFRRTPIGFLHRLIWIYVPNGLAAVDRALTGGRMGSSLQRTGHYLFHEKHPIVMILFLLLLVGAECLFVPPSLSLLPATFARSGLLRTVHYLLLPCLIVPPYVFVYLCYKTRSEIGPSNHHSAMTVYPYDYAIFHPSPGPFNPECWTCHRPRPARSKHCSICGRCVQKADHHCVWINNCVGRNNHVYFMGLVLSLSFLLAYGAWLGHRILTTQLRLESDSGNSRQPTLPRSQGVCFTRTTTSSPDRTDSCTWRGYMTALANMLASHPAIGAPALLSLFTFPLAACFTVYHLYLIWAGMTTNESAKWSDLGEDIADGLVWRGRIEHVHAITGSGMQREQGARHPESQQIPIPIRISKTTWAIAPTWVMVRMSTPNLRPPSRPPSRSPSPQATPTTVRPGTPHHRFRDQTPPHHHHQHERERENEHNHNREHDEDEDETEEAGWRQVHSLSSIENIYDLGFWDNVRDVLVNRE